MDLYWLFGKCLAAKYRQDGGSANYAFERVGDTLYLFFEDSDGAEDWSINLDFPAKAYRRMGKTAWFAHRGFLGAFKRTEKYLSPLISDPSVRNIIVSGYSHGAAIALLCHEYIWFNRPDLRPSLEGYGFGCPRVIWGILRESVARRWEKFLVIRNIDDIVTHLPPTLLGYRHVGRLLEIGEAGKYSPIEAHYPENILDELRRYEKNK